MANKYIYLIFLLLIMPAINAEEFINLNVKTQNNKAIIKSDDGNVNTFQCSIDNEYNFLLKTSNKPTFDKILDMLELQKQSDTYRENWNQCGKREDELRIQSAQKDSEISSLKANKTIFESCDDRINGINDVNGQIMAIKEQEINELKGNIHFLIGIEIFLFISLLSLIIYNIALNLRKKE